MAARNSLTKRRFGRVAPAMCPASFVSRGQRKPKPAKRLSDVAMSADSPLLFPRQNRPPGRASVTSAKKSSGALRRRRRRRVILRRTSPTRRGETDARTSSHRSRLFSGFASVISPAELTTREDRTCRGPKTCMKRHFGIATQVISPAEVPTLAEQKPTTADKLDRVPHWQRGLG